MHAREGYSSHPVLLSVCCSICHTLVVEITDNLLLIQDKFTQKDLTFINPQYFSYLSVLLTHPVVTIIIIKQSTFCISR